MLLIRKDSSGFGVVEALIVVVVLGLIGGGGYYVYNKQSQKNTSQKAANQSTSASTSTTASTPKKVEPTDAVVNLTSAFSQKDAAKFNNLVSDDFKAKTKSQAGSDDVYAAFSQDPVFSAVMTKTDFSKEKATVTDYVSSTGAKGKTVTYSIKTTIDTSTSTNVYTFSFVAKGDAWLLDDVGVDTNASANINSQ